MTSIIVAGLAGAIISAVTGTLWYGMTTPMGKWHMTSLGWYELSAEEQARKIAEAKPKMWKSYLAQFILSFLSSFFIAFVTWYTVQNGGEATAVYYYVPMIWVAFTVPQAGQNIIWGPSKGALAWKRFFSDSLYSLLTFLIIAFVATLIV